MSAISDSLDIIDRSIERAQRVHETLTPSVKAQLAKYRQSAIHKARSEQSAKRKAAATTAAQAAKIARREIWKREIYSLRLTLAEVRGRKKKAEAKANL